MSEVVDQKIIAGSLIKLRPVKVVETESLEDFIFMLSKSYRTAFSRDAAIYRVTLEDGVSIVNNPNELNVTL